MIKRCKVAELWFGTGRWNGRRMNRETEKVAY